jgi:hypothetical protein
MHPNCFRSELVSITCRTSFFISWFFCVQRTRCALYHCQMTCFHACLYFSDFLRATYTLCTVSIIRWHESSA